MVSFHSITCKRIESTYAATTTTTTTTAAAAAATTITAAATTTRRSTNSDRSRARAEVTLNSNNLVVVATEAHVGRTPSIEVVGHGDGTASALGATNGPELLEG
jgi:hypothetical protein